jgi:hypothetical protein
VCLSNGEEVGVRVCVLVWLERENLCIWEKTYNELVFTVTNLDLKKELY